MSLISSCRFASRSNFFLDDDGGVGRVIRRGKYVAV